MKLKHQWDCHFYLNKEGKDKKDISLGIVQLADAIGLRSHLPSSVPKTTEALFGYRNKMFHCGFDSRCMNEKTFQNRILESGWPEHWFSKAEMGSDPWVFYLSEEFVEHCLNMIDKVIDGLGHYWKQELYCASKT